MHRARTPVKSVAPSALDLAVIRELATFVMELAEVVRRDTAHRAMARVKKIWDLAMYVTARRPRSVVVVRAVPPQESHDLSARHVLQGKML